MGKRKTGDSGGLERGDPLDRVPRALQVHEGLLNSSFTENEPDKSDKQDGSPCAGMRMFRKALGVISPANWVDNTRLDGWPPRRKEMPYCSGQMEG